MDMQKSVLLYLKASTSDGKYSAISKNTALNVHVPVYKITANSDISVLYSDKAAYKVLITKDSEAVEAGCSISFTFNGKTYSVKTDSQGYAALNLETDLKPGSYMVSCEFNGVKVSNKITVKNIIKASNKKVKKSAKTTKIKITLSKVNNQILKSKTLKVKFNSKTYKVKTNKKGVAIWSIKKAAVKKLKVGKKVKYTVTYGKDTLTKTITIKK